MAVRFSTTRGSSTTTTDTVSKGTMEGRLTACPSFMGVDGSESEFTLSSDQHMIAVRMQLKTALQIQSLGTHFSTVTSGAMLPIAIYSDGKKPNPDGALNGSKENCFEWMTSNTTPAPVVISGKCANTAFTCIDTQLYKCFDGDDTNNSSFSQLLYLNEPATDEGDGNTGFPHADIGTPIPAGTKIRIQGTHPFPSHYCTVQEGSTSTKTIVNHAYQAWEPNGSQCINIEPSTTYPLFIGVDFGSGNGKRINKMLIEYTTANAFEIGGSNLESPDLADDEDWELLHTVNDGDLLQNKHIWQTITWNNATQYRHIRFKVTDDGWSVYASLQFSQLIYLIESDNTPSPDTLLKSLGTFDTGESGDTWKKETLDTSEYYSVSPNDPVWVVFQGENTGNVTMSYNRQNDSLLSGFPDEFDDAKYSTDGGTSWRKLQKDGRKAMPALIINPTDNLVPQLTYGSTAKGNSVYVGAKKTIPTTGLFAAVDELDEDEYYVYLYDSGGLKLEVTDTKPTATDGVLHKTGNTNYRLVGMVVPQQLIGSYFGAVDNHRMRLVLDEFCTEKRSLTVPCPYVADSSKTDQYKEAGAMAWGQGEDDFKVKFLAKTSVFLNASGSFMQNAANGYFLDGIFQTDKLEYALDTENQAIALLSSAIKGYHSATPAWLPLHATYTNNDATWCYVVDGDIAAAASVAGHVY